MKDEQYYTLTGYKRKNKYTITETMEDYIEMIYRNTKEKEEITIKDLSILLNVRPSSVSKMINKLNKLNIVNFKKYGQISLTEKGKKLGYFYLDRHNTLTTFFKMLNKNQFKLEQVEKIEHFVDKITINNIKKKKKNDN
ncbi:MAG: metal-dependent transcriptional regulator [Bacilli bacterium]|nr:metal-dependent transcriptional regulator [Bacilli bacterium]